MSAGIFYVQKEAIDTMIDPATLKVAAKAAVAVVTDEEARRKARIIIVASFTAVILFLSLCFYILTMPFQLLGNFFFDSNYDKVMDLRLEQGYDTYINVNSENTGEMIWAVDPQYSYISSYFTRRINPITGKEESHRGIDIPAPYDSNVYAALDGVVTVAKWSNSYGNYVVIDHGGGLSTLYAHNSALLKKAGDTVVQGEVIARVGSTGASTGNHVHFEVMTDNILKNPLDYVKQP
jgi:murein DD-endopeptidase MepM/ murein hydrolase activator NlpD